MGPNGVAAVASPANEVRRAIMCRSRAAQDAHWQNRTVPRAAIVWLAHAVNVVRPVALRLHIDRVRFAKQGRALKIHARGLHVGLEIFSMIGRPSTGMFAASNRAADCDKPQLFC